MSKMFIIGAGCSKNYSYIRTDIPGLTCPVDSDFFKIAKKVISSAINRRLESDQIFSVSLDSLLRYLTDNYGNFLDDDILSVLDTPGLSLEKVMTDIAIRGILFEKPQFRFGWEYSSESKSARLMATFVELISRILEETLKGPTCENHKALADLMSSEDVILSYNYDLLMDNALREKGKLSDEGYKLSFYRVYDEESEWARPDYSDQSVSLLKLHGSLNWIRCKICDSMLLLRNKKVGTWYTTAPTKCPKCGGRTDFQFLPETMQRIIVPPLLAKDYTEPAINYLWFEAAKAFNNINEIIVIGYSFPPTDFASESLLMSGLGYRRKNIQVTVVNPDPFVNAGSTLKKRFSDLFDSKNVVYLQTLNEFINRP